MTILSVTEARERLHQLVDEVQHIHEPVQIVGERNSAILISEVDWQAIQETLHLLSISGMRQSIQEGMNKAVDDCAEEPSW